MSTPQQVFALPANMPRDGMLERIGRLLRDLPTGKAYRIEVSEAKAPRTLSQNALLWAIYGEILKKGGEGMGGWTADDLHEFFLCNHFGTEIREMFGKKRQVPMRRSSRLPKLEFSDFVESILRFMAEKGVYIETKTGDL